jgi:hypothetical protein
MKLSPPQESLRTSSQEEPPPSPTAVTRTVDALLLMTVGCIVFYYGVLRYPRYRKVPSLFIALVPLGWVMPELPYGVDRWIGLALCVALLHTATRADRTDSKPAFPPSDQHDT